MCGMPRYDATSRIMGLFPVSFYMEVSIILAGCVPLVLNDGIVLPFEEVLDWRKFSVKVLEADVSKLDKILDEIKLHGEHYEKELRKNIVHLTYGRPAVEGDATFTALVLLKKRLWEHIPMAYSDLSNTQRVTTENRSV